MSSLDNKQVRFQSISTFEPVTKAWKFEVRDRASFSNMVNQWKMKKKYCI